MCVRTHIYLSEHHVLVDLWSILRRVGGIMGVGLIDIIPGGGGVDHTHWNFLVIVVKGNLLFLRCGAAARVAECRGLQDILHSSYWGLLAG